MLVDIRAITLSDEVGAPVCTTARVAIAANETVAIQIIPVDSEGRAYPAYSNSIVGDISDPSINEFLQVLETAAQLLVREKGF